MQRRAAAHNPNAPMVISYEKPPTPPVETPTPPAPVETEPPLVPVKSRRKKK